MLGVELEDPSLPRKRILDHLSQDSSPKTHEQHLRRKPRLILQPSIVNAWLQADQHAEQPGSADSAGRENKGGTPEKKCDVVAATSTYLFLCTYRHIYICMYMYMYLYMSTCMYVSERPKVETPIPQSLGLRAQFRAHHLQRLKPAYSEPQRVGT